MRKRLVISEVAERAAEQHGVVSAKDLAAAGLSTAQIRHRVDAGWLDRITPQVFAIAGTPDTHERRLQTGLLQLGERSWVSYEAAASLHGLDRSDADAVEFTVERGQWIPVYSSPFDSSPFGSTATTSTTSTSTTSTSTNSTSTNSTSSTSTSTNSTTTTTSTTSASSTSSTSTTVHSTSLIGRLDTVHVNGFRVMSATRTVIDLAHARASLPRVAAALDSAVRLGSSHPHVIATRLATLRGSGRWGCRLIEGLLPDSGGHSPLERAFLKVVRELAIERPETQVVQRDATGRHVARVDFMFHNAQLVVEVNGRRGHVSDSERAKDAQRRNELQALGLRVVEYTTGHLRNHRSWVADDLRVHLSRSPGPGSPELAPFASAHATLEQRDT